MRVTGDHGHFVAEQRHDVEATHGFLRTYASDEQVQAAFAQARVGQGREAVEQLQLHVRHLLPERSDRRREQGLRDPGRDADRELLRRLQVPQALHRGLCLLQQRSHLLRMGQQLQAGLRKSHAAAMPIQQGHGGGVFQLLHALGHRGSAHARGAGHGTDAAFGGEQSQVSELVKFHIHGRLHLTATGNALLFAAARRS